MSRIRPRSCPKARYALSVAAVSLGALGSLSTSRAVAGSSASHSLKEAEYVAKALGGKAVSTACARVRVDMPATNSGPAPEPLAALLGVLRQRPDSLSTLTSLNQELLTSSYRDTYVNSLRFARHAFGLSWYVFVAGPLRFGGPLRNLSRCVDAQSLAFRHEGRRIPIALRQATRHMFRAAIRQERRFDSAERRFLASPQVGADLAFKQDNAASISGTWTAYANIAGAFVNTAQSIGIKGFIEPVAITNRGVPQFLVAGIVPDDVATVAVRFSVRRRPSRSRVVKAHAINNVFVAAVPGELTKLGYTVSLRWRGTDGASVRTFP